MNESKSINKKLTHKERTSLVREFYTKKGYRVHSGLQFGCELVLYADIPSRVHSDFCVHIPQHDDNDDNDDNDDCGGGGGGGGGMTMARLNWMTIQVLVRSMPDLHKTLIVAILKECSSDNPDAVCYSYTTGTPTSYTTSTDEEQQLKQRQRQQQQQEEKVRNYAHGTSEIIVHKKYYTLDEIAIVSEHAPFRHKNTTKEVGVQTKKQKT